MIKWSAWKTRGIWVVSAVMAAVSAGCARDRGPIRDNGFSRSSTLGSDLRAVPAGVTVPPPSLGVDLVRSPEKWTAGDPKTIKAGHDGWDDQAR